MAAVSLEEPEFAPAPAGGYEGVCARVLFEYKVRWCLIPFPFLSQIVLVVVRVPTLDDPLDDPLFTHSRRPLPTHSRRSLAHNLLLQADEDNEMNLVEGEVIDNIEEVDEGWWSGTGNGGAKTGLFPGALILCIQH